MTTMYNNTKIKLLAGLLTVVAVLAAGTIGATTSGTKGSIKVCKVIADVNGNIVDGSAYPAATFSVTGFTPSPQTSEGAAAGVLPNSVFNSPLSLNKHVVGTGTAYDAKCLTYSDLSLGNYYYSQETITGVGWLDPLYNDQHTMSVSTLADFLPYSGQLFDGNGSNDGSRNTNSDGHIVLTSAVPNRTLVILNRRAGDVCQTYETRSYGYWKNHSENWTLPQTIGTDVINSNGAVQSIFDNYSNSSLTKLKAQLLAMKFSIAYFGAGPALVPGETITVSTLASQADALIASGSANNFELDNMRKLVETVNLAQSISSCSTEPEVGYLKVIKEVFNDEGGTKSAGDFSLHVKTSNVDVIGSPSAGTSSGVLYVLEPGSYKVSEDLVDGYTGYISGDCSSTGDVNVTADTTKICTIINNDNPPPGECRLEITKSADKQSVTPGDTIEFTLNFENTGTANCTGSGVKVKDVVDPNLNYVSATNSSNVTPGYGTKPLYTSSTRTLIWNANTLTPGEQGWVKWKGEVKTREICGNFNVLNTGYITSQEYNNFGTWVNSNTVEIPGSMSCSATLIVEKHVINDDEGTKQPSDFTMNVTGTNVSSNSFAGDENGTTVTLDAGVYSVDEGEHDGYTKIMGANCSGSIGVGETKTCSITNDDIPLPPPEKSTLIVIKNVVNNHGGTKVAGDFTMNVTGTNISSSSFPGDSTGTIVTLDAGSYSVSEDDQAGYAKSLSADCSGNISEGETKTCTITNDDMPAFLTLIKTVINDDGGMAVADDFTPYVNLNATNWGASIELSAGNYNVSEGDLVNYIAGDWEGDCTAAGAITLALGESKTCSITNNDVAPLTTLIVKKQVINNDAGTKSAADFNINVKLSDSHITGSPAAGSVTGTSYTVTPGNYVISEESVSGYSLASITGDCAADGSVTLAVGETKTCTLINDDIPVETPITRLIVKKQVINDNDGEKTASDFNLHVKSNGADITGSPAAGSETGVNYVVNPGTFVISEDSVSGYTLASITGDCAENGEVTLTLGQVKTCTLTNNDTPSQGSETVLIVKKVVINNNGATQQASLFTLTVSGPSSYFQSFPGSTSGTSFNVNPGTYTVAEPDRLAGYNAPQIGGDCASNGQVTIALGETKTCVVTNDDSGGSCSGNCGGGGGGGGPVCTEANTPRGDSVSVTAGAVSGSSVTLNFTYGNDVNNFAISNSSSFVPQVVISSRPQTTWTFDSGAGERTVYVRFFSPSSCYTVKQVTITPTPQVLGASCINISTEQELATTRDAAMAKNLRGQMIRQCSTNGAVWYMDPASQLRYYLPPNTDSFHVLQQFAVGVTNANLNKIPVGMLTSGSVDTDSDGLSDALEQAFGTSNISADTDGDGFIDGEEVKNGYSPTSNGALPIDLAYTASQAGKIFIQTESAGQIWYVNPIDSKRYLITNDDSVLSLLNQISSCVSDDVAHTLGIGLAANGVSLNTVSSCYPPAPLVLGEIDALPRTGLPSDIVLALPLLIIMGYGVGKIGKDWIDSEV